MPFFNNFIFPKSFVLMLMVFVNVLYSVEMRSGVDAQGLIHVRVWGLVQGPGSTSAERADWRVLKAFEKAYPHIRLHNAAGINLPGVGNENDVGPLLAISGGIAPDILYVNFRKSASYIDNEFLYPLDEYIAEYAKLHGESSLKDLIHPALNKVVTRLGPVQGDRQMKTWMIPAEPLVMTMIYRKDLFARSGLDPNKAPENWTQMYAACEQIVASDPSSYGVLATARGGTSWNFMPYLSSSGTQVLTEDAQGEWKASFARKEAVSALEFYARLHAGLRKDGKTRGFATSNKNLLDEGKIAMAMTYLGGDEMAKVDTSGAQWGFAPVPKGPTGISSAEINARMWGIFRGQKDKRVRDAAFEWLAYRKSKAAVKIRVDTFIEANEISAINPNLLDRLGEEYKKYEIFINQDLKKLYKDLITTAKPEPYGTNCDLVYDYLDKPVQAAILWAREGNLENQSEPVIHKTLFAFLSEGQKELEREMLKELPEKERKKRNRVAMIVTISLFTIFLFTFYKVLKILSPVGQRNNSWQIKKYWKAYVILLPALAIICLWQYYPLLRGALMAFQDYKISIPIVNWVGFDNFADVLYDKNFWYSLWLTFYYSFLVISFTWLPPLLLAIMLDEIPKFSVFFRVLYYLPALISGLVVIFLWKQFFDPSPQGLFNQVLAYVHIGQQYWFEDPHLAMFCLIIPLAWASLGPGCLIYLAALKGVAPDLYEAAEIDGANYWQKIRFVLVPKLWPLLIITLIGQMIISFNAAENVLAMTGGGPNGATNVTGLLIFKKAFVYTEFGTATAMAWIMSLFLIGFTVYQLKILSNLEFKTTGND
ncbi:extracellular solute-binding protein [Lentisphaera profundi]|uniref:Extracellular solute-binding protein n=1 Tax=Lentisphaera profundi TaxID=1658616 RepID=A0ABY7W1G5_9BACT|nr:extracellular solute-binding protein [Lentisphaera profundi]WDE99265.1 extracellular solute-binding protein [Lentisphaera profundi]